MGNLAEFIVVQSRDVTRAISHDALVTSPRSPRGTAGYVPELTFGVTSSAAIRNSRCGCVGAVAVSYRAAEDIALGMPRAHAVFGAGFAVSRGQPLELIRGRLCRDCRAPEVCVVTGVVIERCAGTETNLVCACGVPEEQEMQLSNVRGGRDEDGDTPETRGKLGTCEGDQDNVSDEMGGVT